jgi:hypothetical protein
MEVGYSPTTKDPLIGEVMFDQNDNICKECEYHGKNAVEKDERWADRYRELLDENIKLKEQLKVSTPQERELQRNREDVHDSVQEMAYQIFADCGRKDDYCIQHAGGIVIVFGGWNRIILGRYGWRASKSHCTEEFYNKFQELYGK